MATSFDDAGGIAAIVVSILGCLLGVVGNGLIAVAVIKKTALQTTTNYLLTNIAVADLVTLVFLPFLLLPEFKQFDNGPLADFLCKVFVSKCIPITCITTSALTLAVVAIERYHAVVKPMQVEYKLNEDTVRYAIAATWVLASAVTAPLYIFTHYKAHPSFRCAIAFPTFKVKQYYELSYVFIAVIIPLIIITFSYYQIIKELYFKTGVGPQNIPAAEDAAIRRKVLKLSLAVTTAFTATFLPLAITGAIRNLSDVPVAKLALQIAFIAFVLSTIINPLIHCCLSSNFKEAFKEMLRGSARPDAT